jgi:hypothetical protein
LNTRVIAAPEGIAMDATEVVAQLAEQYREDPQQWPSIAERARGEWGDRPQVGAIVDYLLAMSGSDLDDLLREGSNYDTLQTWIRDGAFEPQAVSDPQYPIDDAYAGGSAQPQDGGGSAQPQDGGGSAQPQDGGGSAQPQDGGDDGIVDGNDLLEELSYDEIQQLFDAGIFVIENYSEA